ncbi:uncharacterized protein [Gossypium hirsutum]|uniref:Receptor-like protein 12 n=1 Tax=Gossypium hirsutum TaxID=3635 RepID=A0A1U8MJA9_GOSHI|nr:uncharacterized protein LOC107937336 [Gossypium hirsutum]
MASSGFSLAAPPIFNGKGYHIWIVKMKTYLQEEFQGTERTRQQQLLDLRRDFENLKMKEEETVKQYSYRIMAVVNSIRLLGEQFNKVRIVENVISTLPEKYEVKISSLEDSKDLTNISLIELINALYAHEQRRASR